MTLIFRLLKLAFRFQGVKERNIMERNIKDFDSSHSLPLAGELNSDTIADACLSPSLLKPLTPITPGENMA